MQSEPFHSTPESAKAIKIPELGLELSVRIPPELLSEAMTLMETVNAAGFGPPLHRHREAEVFRVMEGAYLYEVNGHRFPRPGWRRGLRSPGRGPRLSECVGSAVAAVGYDAARDGRTALFPGAGRNPGFTPS